eukprot:3498991-Amphidinium_carterae.1
MLEIILNIIALPSIPSTAFYLIKAQCGTSIGHMIGVDLVAAASFTPACGFPFSKSRGIDTLPFVSQIALKALQPCGLIVRQSWQRGSFEWTLHVQLWWLSCQDACTRRWSHVLLHQVDAYALRG